MLLRSANVYQLILLLAGARPPTPLPPILITTYESAYFLYNNSYDIPSTKMPRASEKRLLIQWYLHGNFTWSIIIREEDIEMNLFEYSVSSSLLPLSYKLTASLGILPIGCVPLNDFLSLPLLETPFHVPFLSLFQ